MKRMTFSVFIIFCFFIVLSTNAGAGGTQLSYATFFSSTHGQSKLAESWCREVEKRTEGAIIIKYYPAGTLLKSSQIYDGVVSGISDIGFTVLAYTRGRFPLSEAIDLPMGYSSGVQATRVANAVIDRFKPKELDDTEIMYIHAHGPGIIHTSDIRIQTLQDIKGLKIRGTGTSGLIVEALGGSPVGKSMRDSYTMLQKGVVDGSFHPLEANGGWRLGEVVKFATKSSSCAYTTAFAVMMNRKKWNKLTRMQHKIIREINSEWSVKHGVMWDEDDKAGLDFFRAKGGEFIEISSEEEEKWQASVASVIDKYIEKADKKGIDGKAVVSFIRARIND